MFLHEAEALIEEVESVVRALRGVIPGGLRASSNYQDWQKKAVYPLADRLMTISANLKVGAAALKEPGEPTLFSALLE